MTLRLDVIALGAPEAPAARAFYTAAFYTAAFAADAFAPDGDPGIVDLHGTARIAVAATGDLAGAAGANPATTGFRGYVLTCSVQQPTEVRTLMDAAAGGGAEVLKPARKAMFGSFSGTFRAPDGAIWKLAAATGKDTGPAAQTPLPVETTIILGVAAPKRSKVFYEALGMKTDRDYGNKYIDFHPAPGAARLCLMERGVLARDAGTTKEGDGFPAMVLTHAAGSREEAGALVEAAVAAGATAGESGHFTDPDGFYWNVGITS